MTTLREAHWGQIKPLLVGSSTHMKVTNKLKNNQGNKRWTFLGF